MYLLYVAERQSRGATQACFTTFWLVWHKEFRTALRFRKKCQHAKCCRCMRFKEFLRTADSPQSRAQWAKHYGDHLLGTFRDRAKYYAERAQSQAFASGVPRGLPSELTACLILDGMDQAKFSVPRHLPASKEFRAERRPRLHTVGCIMHGFFQYGFLTDCTIRKDADLWIGVVVQCLEKLGTMCRERNLAPPGRLVIQADNASDNKSQFCFRFCMAVVASNTGFCKHIQEVVCEYLRSGHTHEDIGPPAHLVVTGLATGDQDTRRHK